MLYCKNSTKNPNFIVFHLQMTNSNNIYDIQNDVPVVEKRWSG